MIIFVADAFIEHYVGGAELTTEALIGSCLLPKAKVLSQQVTVEFLRQHKKDFFIFGNFQNLNFNCMLYAVENLNYSVLEYDYKYCKLRSPGKHIVESEESCSCGYLWRGKVVCLFMNSAMSLWWMSEAQKLTYKKIYPFLEGEVLSSVFSDGTLEYIDSLDTTCKNNKWIILNSKSWIKGVPDAISYAEENDLEYELVWGLDYRELLDKMAASRGLIFLPKAGDTCPRMVIEAKLLGCELILNDNVQHKMEPWFQTKDSCMAYLKNRTRVFWDELENKIPYLPKDTSIKDNKYVIIVPFYNVEKYISQCILSIKRQQHDNFKCYLIDDLSTDRTVEIAKQLVDGDSRFELIQNEEKHYALGNIHKALKSPDIEDEDIIILLDGDDWFSTSKALLALNSAYEQDCLMTYGSYVLYPFGVLGPEPSKYPEDVIKDNLYREDRWRASHLRTFKYHLWKNVSTKDLKDQNGEFYTMAYDQAIMLPLLEMARERAKYIDSVLHVYNKENPLNVDKLKAQEQARTALDIRKNKRYERVG